VHILISEKVVLLTISASSIVTFRLRYQLSRTQRKLSTVLPMTPMTPVTPKTESMSIPATPVTVGPSEDSNITLGGVITSLGDNTDTDSDNIAQRSETASNATTAIHDSDTEVS